VEDRRGEESKGWGEEFESGGIEGVMGWDLVGGGGVKAGRRGKMREVGEGRVEVRGGWR